ncbi:protein EFFECTOR OF TRANSCRIPTION 2-like isoform X2 [Nymphaea colorata]|nr:protein EFFECTOR OF TRANSCRIPTION 2-like isoform X2 [Nymphaea colorata]
MIRKINSDHVIVVYLGQADNVRARLQQYGRAGSHLDHGVSFPSSNKGEPTDIPAIPYIQQGPGLFIDVFSRGFPIVFRWAPMKNKKEAELKESQLLAFFDYAWNKGSNGSRRADYVLQKLDKAGLGIRAFTLIPLSFKQLKWKALGSKKMGIEIKSGKPIVDTDSNPERNPDLHARVLKFSHSRPRLVAERTGGLDALNVCGVTLGNGSICKEPPVPGRKRCSEHKGKRINGLHKGSNTDDHEATTGGLDPQNVCGVAFGNGSICKEPPVPGRKRCSEHKGRRINGLHEGLNTDHHGPPKGNPCVCGVILEDGSFCKQKPVPGRKRCEKHKGRRVGA